MLDLQERKPLILKKLKKEWKKLEALSDFSSLPLYMTLNFSLPKINIKRLIGFCYEQEPLSYWADKEGKREFLGLGSLHQAGGKNDISGIENIVKENPDLYYLGGINFNPIETKAKEWGAFGEGLFILPLLSYQREEDNHFLKVNFPKSLLFNKQEQAATIFKIDQLLNFNHFSSLKDLDQESPTFNFNQLNTTLSPQKDDWIQTVQKCLSKLKTNKMQKVVLARKKIVKMEETINPFALFEMCQDESKAGNFTFFIRPNSKQAFLSFSPERLFKIEDKTILSDALAGTRPTDAHPEKDLLLEKELVDSKKDSFEHMVVCKTLLEKLRNLSEKVYMTKNMKVMKLRHVQHLHSEFEGELKENLKLEEIISELHPTPAVGGDPWPLAKNFIESNEPFERGLYSSPLGIISKNYTEFAVGIRSALVDNQNLHLFGGAGIVLGSIPEKEWDETQQKMKSFEHYL